MADIRLNKLTRQFNIGIATLIDFLKGKGAKVEDYNPNQKVSDEFLPALEKQFGEDLKKKEEAEKVVIKIKEIIDKPGKKAPNEEDEPIKETVIKTTSLSAGREEKPADTAIVTPPAPVPVPEVKPAPVVEKPVEEKVPAEPVVVETPKEEPVVTEVPVEKAQPQEKPEVQKAEPEEVKAIESDTPKAEPIVEKPQEAKPQNLEEKKNEQRPDKPQVDQPRPQGQDQGRDQHSRKDQRPQGQNQGGKQGGQGQQPKGQNKGPQESQGQQPQPKAAPVNPAPTVKDPEAAAKDSGIAFTVVGKMDLGQFNPKKGKKRERIKAGGTQKVDVTKVAVDDRKKAGDKKAQGQQQGGQNQNGKQGGKGANAQAANGRDKKRNRGNERFKPAMTQAEEEEMQKEIQKQVKETYARMNDSKKSNFGAKYRKEKREQASQRMQEEQEQVAAEKKVLKVTEFVTVNDLATLMDNTPVNKVIGACMSLGLMVSINQRLDAEALSLVAEEFGYKVEFVTAELTQEINQQDDNDDDSNLETRPPVITVMGHVDHGKTSLLDYIRKTNVIAGEAGGITQHIGAYNVVLPSGRRITFLDTPGHEAFTAMRARGAQLTDLAIIIIAADDAVMPQTIEAINHAQAAGVPMVFAINKIDKPGAHSEKIYQQLSQMNILTEAWGGKYQCQEISAKKGLNVDKLLDKVILETELMNLKANPKKLGVGSVIESSLDKGRGYLATILVQDGTIHKGDMMLSGHYYGRIKSMFNERGQQVDEAGPSTPVSILGLNGAPSAGEKFNIMLDEKEAKSIAGKREQLIRIQGIKTQKHMTLEEIGRRIAIGNFKELNVIVKGDVDGSVEALSDSLIKLSTEEVHVNVIHKAVGAISESDIMLATASDAIIIGFQVRPSSDARNLAEKEGIEIRLYSIIYDAINEVKDGIEGMLEPEKKEEVTSTAFVKQAFHISKVGTIAGSLIKEGKMTKGSKVRLIRDGIVVYTGELSSLKRGKDDAKEVQAGMECGIGIANYNDIKDGDIIEAFQIVEIKRTL